MLALPLVWRAIWSIPFLALLGWRLLPSLWRAFKLPEAARLRAAVKAGVLSLVVLDAAVAAGFAGWLYGAAVLALLPVAGRLARVFAVT
jgi:4-hydroxybenzoate polyprenyltransferase